MEDKELVGVVTHFFPQIMVAVVRLEKDLRIGDTVQIEGHGQNFEQVVESIQIDKKPIHSAKRGQEIAIKVANPVKEKDQIFRAED